MKRLIIAAILISSVTASGCGSPRPASPDAPGTAAAQPADATITGGTGDATAPTSPPVGDADTAALPSGDTAEPAPADTVAEAQLPDPTPPAPQDPNKIGDYIAPAALSATERTRRYPKGDLAASRDANKRGLERRAAGDKVGALAEYRAAVEASPSYTPARFNLACELATSAEPGVRDAAIGHLEDLLRIGSGEAREYVALAAFDEDFKALRDDPRFQAIVGSVRFDPELSFEQLCTDPGRIASLIDGAKGFVDFVETEATPDGKPAKHEERHVVGKDALKAALAQLKELSTYLCAAERDPEMTGSLFTYKLARAGDKDPVCLAYDHSMEWSEQFLVCLARQPDGFRIASMATFPTGPIEPAAMAPVMKRVRSARDKGLALFGKSMKGD
jgi:hypothetical protein